MRSGLVLILLSLVAFSCGCDNPTAQSTGSSSAASAETPAGGCPALAKHWREVWTAEGPSGLDHRRDQVIGHVATMWSNACASVAKEPTQDLGPVVEELQKARTFAAIEDRL